MAKRNSSEQVRRFGPLTSLVVAAVLAFLVLPSTLTLPNPSPTSQEEIAPVPPTQSKTNPPISNFTSLSAGTTGNGLGDVGPGGGTKPGVAPPALPPGLGNLPPATYQCVAGRQTEDPLSPTCVPFYQGDNGGSTYQGVSAKEVRVVIYHEPYGTLNTSQGTSTPPYNTIVDTDLPAKPNEHPDVTTARGWSKFFGTRYAAYNRHVHIYVQFGSYDSSSRTSAGTQAQDAALAYAKLKPFAIINLSGFGNGAFYNNYMSQHSVMIFGSVTARSAKSFDEFPGLQWGYLPPYEYSAAQYANAVCNTVKDKPTAGVGPNSTTVSNNQPRKYGLYYTTDPAFEGLGDAAKLARDLMRKQCGLEVTIEQTYATNSYSVDNGTTPRSATNVALAFQQKGVTTILWPFGYEVKLSGALKSLNYLPEIIVGDDNQQASTQGGSFQDQVAWAQAMIVSNVTYVPRTQERICYVEYRTVDQNSPQSDVGSFACGVYNDLRQMYTGIQVAGPNLTPKSVDQGFHAIPIVESTNAQLPTCYYLASDYTCVKDSVLEHWDPTQKTEDARDGGCWRMVGNGKRYLPGKFPTQNMYALRGANDVCNNFRIFANLQLAPGTG